jgi:hypothetical protein
VTLRELLQSANRDEVFQYLHAKDLKFAHVESEKSTLEQVSRAYGHVMDELLSKLAAPSYDMPTLVRKSNAPLAADDGEDFVEVLHRNLNYVAPPAGFKAWGGKDAPEGHYDCNDDKHNEVFSFGFTPWSAVIDTAVENESGLSNDHALAEILWELTFFGWTEASRQQKVDELSKDLSERIEDLESDDE